MPYVQGGSPFLVTTPFGADKLLLQSFEGEERISGLFRYRLELISEDKSLDFSTIVGQNATLTLALPTGGTQYVNGVVARFGQAGQDARFTIYYADLRPWLWLLGMNADCRIFQNMSVPAIIKQVFSDLGCTAFKDALTATYNPREYCVQYNETALAFVSRLMEEEGIFYFFEHDSSAHTLVLADDATAYAACPGLTQATLRAPSDTAASEDAIVACRLEHQVVVGQYKLDDYNFQTPATDLLATASGSGTSRSWYAYPGKYTAKDDGETRAGLRLTALEAAAIQLAGNSTCRAFHSGCTFTLAGHPRDDINAKYVLTAVTHRGDQITYSNAFEAVPATQTFRPPPRTPRPAVQGCQTALVVGKSGEEIWTDSYGRIKVKFHWDQSSASDETSSCWIRVAQGWAGKQWGGMFLPRVGQEVVVSFEEGDPDRPLVTGGVYNAQQTTPYTLPDDQTKSTIKSHSSPNQEGFNELRFEDKAGSEELFMQAQKDMNVTVLNDQAITVTNNRTVTVQQKDETLVVDKGNRTINVNTGNETHTVKGTRAVTVTGNETFTDQADFSRTVTGNYTLKVSGNLSIEVSGSVAIKAGTSLNNEAGTSLENKAGTSLTNQSGTSLTNNAGTSMSNQAQTSIESKANTQHSVESSGIMVVKGSLVQIN
jgi:type VI secretion system secreted protein VgrG